MGRPKIKIIDDSLPAEEVKTKEPKVAPAPKAEKKEIKVKQNEADSLVAKLNEELGITEAEPTPSEPSSSNKEPEIKPEEKKAKTKVQKPGKAKPRSKKYQEKIELLNTDTKSEEEIENYSFKSNHYKVDQAIELVKKGSYSKFNGTLEAHINTSQANIRGTVSLPFASGKKLVILAFGQGGTEAGADIVGDDSTIDEIVSGKVNFNIVITTPEWMPKLAKTAKILGPRGLMPNPKNGTITTDLEKTVASFQGGKTEYKTEGKALVMHLSLGKLNQPTEELTQNVKVLLQTLGKSRVRKVTLSPTMGPGVKLDLSSI